MSLQFRLLTRSKNDLSVPFDALRMNGNVPFFSLDSRADSVSNASVFHRLNATTFLAQDRGSRGRWGRRQAIAAVWPPAHIAQVRLDFKALTLGGQHRGNWSESVMVK